MEKRGSVNALTDRLHWDLRLYYTLENPRKSAPLSVLIVEDFSIPVYASLDIRVLTLLPCPGRGIFLLHGTRQLPMEQTALRMCFFLTDLS